MGPLLQKSGITPLISRRDAQPRQSATVESTNGLQTARHERIDGAPPASPKGNVEIDDAGAASPIRDPVQQEEVRQLNCNSRISEAHRGVDRRGR